MMNKYLRQQQNVILNYSFTITLIVITLLFATSTSFAHSISTLTKEELEWIRAHPIIKATIKEEAAPSEFVRAGEAAGYSVDYLNLIAEKTGLKIEYVVDLSWAESQQMLKDRKIDISHNILKTIEREKYLNFTEPYLSLTTVIYGRSGSTIITNVDDLKGKKIGTVKGWGPTQSYLDIYPDLDFVEMDNSTDALLSVATGVIDLYISPRSIGNSLIAKNYISGIGVVGNSNVLEVPYNGSSRLAARNDWPELIKILEKGMAAVTNIEMRNLQEKWQIYNGIDKKLDLTQQEIEWLHNNPIIKVAVDPSIPPVEFTSDDGKINGISGSYLEIISEKLNIDFIWVRNNSFFDGYQKTIEGKADILSAINPTPNRSEHLLFTDSYMSVNSVIFSREGGELYTDMDQLAGKKIAENAGFVISNLIKKDYPAIEIIEAPSRAEALKMLSAGTVDAHIGSVPITSHVVAEESITNVIVTGETPYHGDIAFGIRKDLPLLASAMQKAYQSITVEEKNSIRSKWIFIKTSPGLDYETILQISVIAAIFVAFILFRNYSLNKEITLRKKSEERFKQIAETVDGVFFICSADLYNIEYLSPNFEKWSHYKCDDIYQDAALWMEFVHPEDIEFFKGSIAKAKENEFATQFPEYRILTKDDQIKWISTQIHPIKNEDGKIEKNIGFLTDITASIIAAETLKEREEQLRHSQKMDAVGKLTGGIAHDFNNILGIILGNLEILSMTQRTDPKATERIEKAIKGADRGASLVKKLLSFSRKTPHTLQIVNVNEQIKNLIDFIKRTLTISVQIEVKLEDEIWPVEIDAGDLGDALLNLAVNARDAMPDGGKLIITTQNISLDNNFTRNTPESSAGDYVLISIEDTGQGIHPQNLEKVLEPFYTTKGANQGTGLGLSMVHGFINRSKGFMKINSELDHGSTFKLYIPRSYKIKGQQSIATNKASKIPKGNEAILIVDDEQHLCAIAKTYLNQFGYKTYTASNPEDALRILQENSDIKLLFSDIVLSHKLNGYQLANKALIINPDLKVLFTSGFTQDLENHIDPTDEVMQELSQNILPKPYTSKDLAIAVRFTLDNRDIFALNVASE